MDRFTVKSAKKQEMIDVTDEVARVIAARAPKGDGACVVFTPHTTAAVTINENADPDVQRDMLLGLEIISPERPEYRHFEHNSSAHLKASLVGNSVTLIVENGKPVLGRWQAVYLCEFDGPREREIMVRLLQARKEET